MEYLHRSALYQESRAIRELCRNCENLAGQGLSQTLINARKEFNFVCEHIQQNHRDLLSFSRRGFVCPFAAY